MVEKAWRHRFTEKGVYHKNANKGEVQGPKDNWATLQSDQELLPSLFQLHVESYQGCPVQNSPATEQMVSEIHPNSCPVCIPYRRGIWNGQNEEFGIRRPCKIGLRHLLAVWIWGSYFSRPHFSHLENNNNESNCRIKFTVENHNMCVSYCAAKRIQD